MPQVAAIIRVVLPGQPTEIHDLAAKPAMCPLPKHHKTTKQSSTCLCFGEWSPLFHMVLGGKITDGCKCTSITVPRERTNIPNFPHTKLVLCVLSLYLNAGGKAV